MTAEKAANDNYLKWREKKAGECPIAPELAKIIEKEHAASLHKQTPFFLYGMLEIIANQVNSWFVFLFLEKLFIVTRCLSSIYMQILRFHTPGIEILNK